LGAQAHRKNIVVHNRLLYLPPKHRDREALAVGLPFEQYSLTLGLFTSR
jgi:hypothetical protein